MPDSSFTWANSAYSPGASNVAVVVASRSLWPSRRRRARYIGRLGHVRRGGQLLVQQHGPTLHLQVDMTSHRPAERRHDLAGGAGVACELGALLRTPGEV